MLQQYSICCRLTARRSYLHCLRLTVPIRYLPIQCCLHRTIESCLQKTGSLNEKRRMLQHWTQMIGLRKLLRWMTRSPLKMRKKRSE